MERRGFGTIVIREGKNAPEGLGGEGGGQTWHWRGGGRNPVNILEGLKKKKPMNEKRRKGGVTKSFLNKNVHWKEWEENIP